MALPKIYEKFKQYLPLSGGTMTGGISFTGVENVIRTLDTNHWFRFFAGPTSDDGARLSLAGKDIPNQNGEFHLVANDGTNESTLLGKPDGTLQFVGKNIVRSINGVNAGVAGDVVLNDVPIDHYYGTAGGYIKTAGGLLIQWGFNSSTTQDVTCSLLQPYKAADYWCAAMIAFTLSTQVNYNPLVTDRTTTSFLFKSQLAKAASAFWIAIGLY